MQRGISLLQSSNPGNQVPRVSSSQLANSTSAYVCKSASCGKRSMPVIHNVHKVMSIDSRAMVYVKEATYNSVPVDHTDPKI
jgi:hypothetical protein